MSTSPAENAAALLDVERADDAAGEVLHLLRIAFDDDDPGGDHRAGDLRGRRPAADAAGKKRTTMLVPIT